jgi:hypothetical protein
MAWRRQQSGEMHWSKDFVEHLRTVHFALLVTCVALIVIKTSGTESIYQKARNQIDLVKKLLPTLNADTFGDEAEKVYSAVNKRKASNYINSYRRGSEVFRASISVDDVFWLGRLRGEARSHPKCTRDIRCEQGNGRTPRYPLEFRHWKTLKQRGMRSASITSWGAATV